MPTTTAARPLGGKALPPIPNLHHVSSRNSPFKLLSISRGFFGSLDSINSCSRSKPNDKQLDAKTYGQNTKENNLRIHQL
ncbi:unnamed protein product [Sphagnum balticum]